MTNSIAEVKYNDCLFLIGTNTAENHPVIWYQMVQALRNGARLIVADPRETQPAQKADIFLQLTPGTNIALINALTRVIINEELYDQEFVAEQTEGFAMIREAVWPYNPEYASTVTGVDAELIIAAARTYATSSRSGIYYAMGITQHSTGVRTVQALSNLALICGNIGKEFAGLNPLRGQSNVQGACDMGALPDVYPGYQKVDDPDVRDRFERAWGVRLPAQRGIRATEVAEAIEAGEIGAVYVMGENIMVSDPDVSHVERALRKLDFLVVQDIFLTETAELADVVLPAACFAEKDGTFTNTERRVQLLNKAVDAPGEALPDWQILAGIMKRLGYPADYGHPAEIMAEIASVTPQYGGMSYGRLKPAGLQWPCPSPEHPGTRYLHRAQIARGKGLLIPVRHEAAKELPDDDYPLILTTGRILYHYHTRSMTGRVPGLNQIAPDSFVEINPDTAVQLGVNDGDMVRVSSRRGSIETSARVTEHIAAGVVFIPFHYAQGNANVLTNVALDPVAQIPELKVAAVRIELLAPVEEREGREEARDAQEA